ncbi:hypothetical protein CDIK_1798 [Cucumispora dikerogammari]|nr:hypothetical protein CDIK_1798 [Cucumispora dikerogammari]
MLRIISNKIFLFTNIPDASQTSKPTADLYVSCSGIRSQIGPIIYFCLVRQKDAKSIKLERPTLKTFKEPFILYSIPPGIIDNTEQNTYIKLHKTAITKIVKQAQKNYKIDRMFSSFIPRTLIEHLKKLIHNQHFRGTSFTRYTQVIADLCIVEVFLIYENGFNFKFGEKFWRLDRIKLLLVENSEKKEIFKRILRKQRHYLLN